MSPIKNLLSKPTRKWPLILLLFLVVIVIFAKAFGVIINISPSMKEGIYIKQYGKIGRGDIVALCLKNPYKKIGLERSYIAKGKKCDGTYPLIKKILAVPCDNVTLTNQYLEVNKIKYPYKTFYVDGAGRKLAVYPRGNYYDTKGYWMIGTHAINSWDSRYWGPINKDQILYKLRPLLVW